MVFSPGRINIIGEHTDYNNGFVLPAAIDKGIYLAMASSNTNKSTFVALDLEENYVFDSQHIDIAPRGSWQNYLLGVMIELQKIGVVLPQLQVVFTGDIPLGAGLSSSAALENAIVFAINEYCELKLSKREMISIAQQAEHNTVGVKCGIMDQYASMFGEKGKALHLDCKTIIANPIDIQLGKYEIILLNTNVKHSLADSAYNDRRAVCMHIANILGADTLREVTKEELLGIKNNVDSVDYQRALFVLQENERTWQAVNAMQNVDIQQLGQLMYTAHEGLSNQYQVSCLELDFLVEYAYQHKAVVGARMMGGGFGGCTINLVEKNYREVFIEEVKMAYFHKFGKICSDYTVEIGAGTHLIEW